MRHREQHPEQNPEPAPVPQTDPAACGQSVLPDLSAYMEEKPKEKPAEQPLSDATRYYTPVRPPVQNTPPVPPRPPVPPVPPRRTDSRPPEPEPKRRWSAAAVSALSAAVVLLVGFLAVVIWGLVLQNGNEIYPNVYVAGVNVGGLDRLEAMDAVQSAVKNAYSSKDLDVRLPDRTISFQPEQTNVALDTDDAIDEALTYGRDGNLFSAILAYLRADRAPHYIDLETMLQLDTEYLHRLIDQVAQEITCEAVPSRVEYNAATREIIVKVGTSAQRLDTEGLYETVYNAFMSGNFEPITWDYDRTPAELLDLKPYYDHYCTEMENAAYDPETHEISEEVTGFGFDLQAASQKLAMAAEGSELTFRLEEIPPEVTKAQLEEEMFGQVLYTVSTAYVNNPGRTRNLELACEAINGTILNPDEVFSFNGIVGERTAEKGYQGAIVYLEGGASSEELGGGVCQVASTIYYLTLFLDLEQVHREPHMFKVDYVPYGMDATVYWGQIDYKFRNSYENPMKIEANIDGGTVNVTFYGVPELDYTVEMEYEILETYPWQEVEEIDEEKPVGYRELAETPYTGYKVVTYKLLYDEDGELISRTKEATSNYKKRDKKYIIGPPYEGWVPSEEGDLPPEEDEPFPGYSDLFPTPGTDPGEGEENSGEFWPDFGSEDP